MVQMGKQVLNVVFGEKSYLSYFFPNMRYGLYIFQLTFFLSSLKRSQEIFDLFYQKTLPAWAPYKRQKRFREIFCFCKDIREKHCVRIVNDSADTHEIILLGKSKKLTKK